MAFLLRAGGTLLIFGTLLYVVGSLASVRRAQMAFAVGELAKSSLDWSDTASRIGAALMILGLLAALVALFLVIRKAMRRKS